jgi:hypothetical protein
MYPINLSDWSDSATTNFHLFALFRVLNTDAAFTVALLPKTFTFYNYKCNP